MNLEQCPICGNELEVKEVTPCFDCGSIDDQVTLLRQDVEEGYEHDSIRYNVYRIFNQIEISLCELCAMEFSQYDPHYFGLLSSQELKYGKMQFIKSVREPQVGKDKYCPSCQKRLSFIKFVLEVRNKDAF